jgi:hypothetical protein
VRLGIAIEFACIEAPAATVRAQRRAQSLLDEASAHTLDRRHSNIQRLDNQNNDQAITSALTGYQGQKPGLR